MTDSDRPTPKEPYEAPRLIELLCCFADCTNKPAFRFWFEPESVYLKKGFVCEEHRPLLQDLNDQHWDSIVAISQIHFAELKGRSAMP